MLAATARVHPFVIDRGKTVARRIRDSMVVPDGLMAPAFLRHTRPSGTLSRFAAHEPAARLASRVTQAFVDASARPLSAPRMSSAATFGRDFVPAGAHTLQAAALRRRRGPVGMTLPQVSRVVTGPGDDVRGLAGVVRDTLDPLESVAPGCSTGWRPGGWHARRRAADARGRRA